MMTILYRVHDNLYINLTNRCPCACRFCLRRTRDHMEDSDTLWLDHEPASDEVIAALRKQDMSAYREVVFCGFGEPTEALDVLLETAAYIRRHFQNPIRLNTNGLGSLINGKNIAPLLNGLIDTVSISLNTPDADRYLEIVQPSFGAGSFEAMLDFGRECVQYVPQVVFTTVATTISKEEEERCAAICREIGAAYRIRAYEP